MIVHEILILGLSLITCIVIALVNVGARWLRICLIIVLLNIMIRRVDALTTYFFGFDFISADMTYLLLYSVLVTVITLFVLAWRRKPYLLHAEQERRADERLKRNAALLAAHEKRMAEVMGKNDYAFESYEGVSELNQQITEALK